MQSKMSPSLLNLNDYCLYKILDYSNFKDQIKFLILCERLQNVYFQYLKTNKNIIIDLYNDLDWPTLDELKYAFNIMGPIMEEFKINLIGKNLHWFYECFKYVLNNCSQLKCLEIENRSVKTYQELRLKTPDFHKYIELIADKLINLKYLKINDLQLLDSDIEILAKSKLVYQLEHLDISNHKEITGKHLENFINLKTLKLAKCCDYSCKNLVIVFQNLINLKHLDLEFCYQLNDFQIGEIINNCKNLEILKININFIGGYQNLQNLNKLKNLKSLTVIETVRGNLTEIISFRKIFDEILKKLAMQLTHFKTYFSQYDNDKGLKSYKRFDALKIFQKLNLLHLDGYIQCDDKFWQSLETLILKTNLKILNITFTNGIKNFTIREFVQFLIRLKNKRQTLKINLEVNEHMIMSKHFLKRMIEQISLHEDEDLNFKDDNYFTLWAVVERKHESDFKNQKLFGDAMKYFNIILEENYFEYYNSKKYHDNEIYLTDLNPLRINRRQSIPERNQELLEIQQYNMDTISPTPNRRFAQNQNDHNNSNGYTNAELSLDLTNQNLLNNEEHYSPEAFERRKSLGKAQIVFSSDLDFKILKIKKRLHKRNSLK